MITPKIPENETELLEAIKSYDVLDTLPEKDYDNITELVASICDIPIALITTLDENRIFFKSHYGIPFTESRRDISFCGHTILEDDILIVEDARRDERFKDNPLVTKQNAIFYAGVPLINPEGLKLGTICAFDHKPRQFSSSQIKAMRILGNQVVQLLELRRHNDKLRNAKLEIESRYDQLIKFASHVSHDLKSPLANIMSLTDLLKDESDQNTSKDSLKYINAIDSSATILKDYIDGILKHYKTNALIDSKKETIQLSDICNNLNQLFFFEENELVYRNVEIENINKDALYQILINLVDNAIKYNSNSLRIVKIDYESLTTHHKFSVSDNGMGIPDQQQEQIFEIFKTIKSDFNTSGTGLGLSSVKNLVEKLGGVISVYSEEGHGSTFTFTMAK